MIFKHIRAVGAALILTMTPAAASACACGCGIFDIGAGGLTPNSADSGLAVWFRIAFMNQNRNWEGSSGAPAADNPDKRINTTFYFIGGQYVINRNWSVMVELPLFDRSFTSTDDGTIAGPAGSLYTAHDFAAGDLEASVMYTGFDKDMSTGLGLGIKAPTGDRHGPKGPLGGQAMDRDTLPGTGSTDLMVSGYHVGTLNRANTLGYFVQAKYQIPIATQDQYRPGNEFNGAVGLTYDFGRHGPFKSIAPVLQLITSIRGHDSGENANPLNSGYERMLIDPGVSLRLKKVRFDADVAIPLYQHVNFDPAGVGQGSAGQLVSRVMAKFQVTYDF